MSDEADIRTTCYSANVKKLARAMDISESESADSVLKAALQRITQSGLNRDISFDAWLELGNNFRTTHKEHA